jgi:hypothetical protein
MPASCLQRIYAIFKMQHNMSTSGKDWQFVPRKKNGPRWNKSRRNATHADGAACDTCGRAACAKHKDTPGSRHPTHREAFYQRVATDASPTDDLVEDCSNAPAAGDSTNATADFEIIKPVNGESTLRAACIANAGQWNSLRFSPRARVVREVVTRSERRSVLAGEERALPLLFHVTCCDESVSSLPVLLGVPRKTISSAAHSLAERYVKNFSSLPMEEPVSAAKCDSANPTALTATITLLTQEDLVDMQTADAHATADRKAECGSHEAHRYEVLVSIVSRRGLRCDFVRVTELATDDHGPKWDMSVVLSSTSVDFVGAVAFCTVTNAAVRQLRGMHSIAFKFARSVAATLTPALMATCLEDAGYGPLLSASLRSNLHDALVANGDSVLDKLSSTAFENLVPATISETSGNTVLQKKMLSILMRDPGEDAVLAAEKEVLGRTMHFDCVSDRQLVWGCEAWQLPRDGTLPEIALYDRLLSRKLHAARGVAAALTRVRAQTEPPDASNRGEAPTHVLITENGARAARRSEQHALRSSRRVAMWWEPRMSVAMVRNCVHHTMDVLWSGNAAKRTSVQHVASFARGTPPNVTDHGVADRASNEALVDWICKRLGKGSLHQQAVLELLVAGNVLLPVYHRMFANTWRRRWRLASLRALQARTDLSREARIEAYCLLCARLARHVKPPLFYVPDIFTLLVQDLWLFDTDTSGGSSQ